MLRPMHVLNISNITALYDVLLGIDWQLQQVIMW